LQINPKLKNMQGLDWKKFFLRFSFPIANAPSEQRATDLCSAELTIDTGFFQLRPR
jgi:hypothetical protein